MCLYCSGWIKYCMWVTAGISTFMGGSRSQNVSQCHCATDGTTSKLAGTYPPVKCTSVYFCDFDLSPLCICSCLPGPYMCSDRHQIFFLNRIPSGTRDMVLSVFQNLQLFVFFVFFYSFLWSRPVLSMVEWHEYPLQIQRVFHFIPWSVGYIVLHESYSNKLIYFYAHTHTHQIWQQSPGWKLLHPSCCVTAHVFSGMAEMCVILEIWEWGGTLLPFVLWAGSKADMHQNPHMGSYSKFWFIVFI